MKTKRILCRMKPRDIKNGIKGLQCHCPIAYCVKRTIDAPVLEVIVTRDNIRCWVKDSPDLLFKTPVRVLRFSNKFDNNKLVKPINFYLEEVTR